MLGGSDAGAHLDLMCHANYPTVVLGEVVRDRGLLSLEEAVEMMTDRPARHYGLRHRGRVAEGWFADLVVFDPAEMASSAHRATPRPPGRRRAALRRRSGDRPCLRRRPGGPGPTARSPANVPDGCSARGATPKRSPWQMSGGRSTVNDEGRPADGGRVVRRQVCHGSRHLGHIDQTTHGGRRSGEQSHVGPFG